MVLRQLFLLRSPSTLCSEGSVYHYNHIICLELSLHFGFCTLDFVIYACRVHKLTKFFGEEPPLLGLFLEKLGYERYLRQFEEEKIGMVELPYISEDRLQRLGIPMGPRMRILQEAQGEVWGHKSRATL